MNGNDFEGSSRSHHELFFSMRLQGMTKENKYNRLLGWLVSVLMCETDG